VFDAGRVASTGRPRTACLLHRLMEPRGGSRSVRPTTERGRIEKVVELELHDADGRRRHVFRPGEGTARQRWRWDCATPAIAPVAALRGARRARRSAAFRTDASWGGRRGRLEVSFDVPRLALLGGDYDLAVGAHEPGTHPPPASSTAWCASRSPRPWTARRRGLRGSWSGWRVAWTGSGAGDRPEDSADRARAEAARKRAAGGTREPSRRAARRHDRGGVALTETWPSGR